MGIILCKSYSDVTLPINPYDFSEHSKSFIVFQIIPMFYNACIFIHTVRTYQLNNPFFWYLPAKNIYELNNAPSMESQNVTLFGNKTF